MRDAVATMGGILPKDVGGRDAVHIACLSVVAPCDLHPGQDVGVTKTDVILIDEYKADPMSDNLIGIVDPFIKGIVRKGDRFWLFLYPRTITGLNHHWTHPAFDDPQEVSASEQWIDNFAGQYGLRASRMIEEADEFVRTGDYFSMGGTFEGESVPDEFWDHYEKVKGLKPHTVARESFFSCAC